MRCITRDVMRERIAGIYCVRDPEGLEYIGSSVDVDRRMREHRAILNAHAHHSRNLQDSWNRHNGEGFSFLVLLQVPDVSRLREIEQAYIDAHFPALNMSTVVSGVVLSDEERERRDVERFEKTKPEWRAAAACLALSDVARECAEVDNRSALFLARWKAKMERMSARKVSYARFVWSKEYGRAQATVAKRYEALKSLRWGAVSVEWFGTVRDYTENPSRQRFRSEFRGARCGHEYVYESQAWRCLYIRRNEAGLDSAARTC